MDIASATLRQAAVMVGSGVALGGVLSIWGAHALSSAGFAADGIDALSIGLPLAVVAVAAAVAVLPAARRAAHTDPLIALRSD